MYKREMTFEGRKFDCAEQAYQFGKFEDETAREWAMQAPSPHLLSIVAHGLFAWDIVPNWAKIKVDRMRAVVLAKFAQHADLRELLIGTGTAILIEASNFDPFWGVGPKGTGRNMLGRILMEVRDKLNANNIEYKGGK